MPYIFNSPYPAPTTFRTAYKRPGAPDPYWAGGEYPPQQNNALRNAAIFGGAIAGIGAAGFIPAGGGKRIWDYYLSGIRHAEELSPYGMFKTFQFSQIFSPAGTVPSRILTPSGFFMEEVVDPVTGVVTRTPRYRAQHFASNMLGLKPNELAVTGAFHRGIEFRRTGLLFGEASVRGGPTLTRAALPVNLGSSAGRGFIDAYAKVSGLSSAGGTTAQAERMFVTAPYTDKVLGIPLSEVAAIRLQKTRVIGRYARAYWASQISRLNRLLEAAYEFPVVGRALTWTEKNIGFRLPVKPGTATQTLLRYAGKGLAIAAAFKGFEYFSYLRSRQEASFGTSLIGAGIGASALGAISKNPRTALWGAAIGGLIGASPAFDRGIIPGIAELWARGHVSYAKNVSEPLGLTRATEEQESLMPGITKLSTVAGFAGAAWLGSWPLQIYRKFSLLNKLKGTPEAKSLGIYGAYSELLKKGKAEFAEAASLAKGPLAKFKAAFFPAAETATQKATKGFLYGGRQAGLAGLALWGGFALAASLATGSFPGILGTEKTAEELEDIYSGRKEVPIRRGRFWEFGRSSWEGGRISHYRPHQVALLRSGAEARAKALYGSEEERWAYDPMLHPFKALFDKDFKYHWEKKYYHERPYPVSGTYFEDVPFIGPATQQIGKLIKPPRLMHTEEWLLGGGENISSDAIVKRVPTAALSEPNKEIGGISPATPIASHGMESSLGRFMYNINELRGLTGFVHGAIKEHLTGTQDYFDQYEQLESARRAYGAERKYWDLDLGGGLGLTEPIRRFIPHRRRQIGLYNPIRNLMPEWLPGPNYYIDFRHGDPFTKVPSGEIRLPGAGYSALNPDVAGLTPAEYPLFHRFKILADVAMYSDEFKRTKIEAAKAAKQGLLTEDQIAQIQEINQQVSEKKKRKRFNEYQFTQDTLQKMRVHVKEQISPGTFVTEKHGVIKLSGIQMAKEQIASENAEKLMAVDTRKKRAMMSDFLEQYGTPGTALDVYVHKDLNHRYKLTSKGAYQPAAISAEGTDLAAELVSQGIAEYKEDDVFANASKYNAGERILGQLWETFTHHESPLEYLTPISPMSKFVHQRSAIEEYERSRTYGTEAALWQHPVEHFIRPATWMTKRMFGTEEIPAHVRQRWEIEEYFDKLKYVKAKILERAADSAGDMEAAKEFREQQRTTLFGTNPYGSWKNIFSALPALDRDYFSAFQSAQSTEDRAKIMEIIPPNQKPIYQAQWNIQLANALRAEKRMGISTNESEKLLDSLYKQRVGEGREVTPESMEKYEKQKYKKESYADWARRKELEEYFNEHPLPGPDFVGFDPRVDLEDVKLKVVNMAGQDMHDFNLWQSRDKQLARKPYLEGSEAKVTGEVQYSEAEMKARLAEVLGLDNIQVVSMPSGDSRDYVEVNLKDDRKRALKLYASNPEFHGMV